MHDCLFETMAHTSRTHRELFKETFKLRNLINQRKRFFKQVNEKKITQSIRRRKITVDENN